LRRDRPFFVEAKKDGDFLRPPQKIFAIVVSKVAGLDFALFEIEAAKIYRRASPAFKDLVITETIPSECLAYMD